MRILRAALLLVFAALFMAPIAAPASIYQSPQQTLSTACASGTNCPSGSTFLIYTQGPAQITAQIANSFVANAAFEFAVDCSNFTAVSMTPQSGGTVVTSASAAGTWIGNVNTKGCFRVRLSSYTSGSVSSTLTQDVAVVHGAGSNTIGNVGLTGVNPCVSNLAAPFALNQNTAATFQLAPPNAGQTVTVCGLLLAAQGATTVTIETGTGTLCGTGTSVVAGPFSLTATTAPITQSFAFSLPAGAALCVINSAAIQLGGTVSIYQH